MSTKLRDFIKIVRNCKTLQEERSLIQKELASIRHVFKDGKTHYHNRCMLKLLYITMLGYPTEFSQMEVIKLIAQPKYAGKRIGYLSMAIMLDEKSEVLMLAENHIKKDLDNCNPYIQSLAFDTVANIAGEDMARDVLHEVQNYVNSTNVYLKKKACLAALRVVKKVPEHSETFCEPLANLFVERNHGALLTSLALVNECLRGPFASQHLPHFRSMVPTAARMLQQLIMNTRATDCDIQGHTSPFLQVRMLQFLRLCGTGCKATSIMMNDVLAQVLTNTDGARNVGSAILYEAVRTIIAIESDDTLRALAVTTLGRFLAASDINIRYVALTSLLQIVRKAPADVQAHHATIVDCLREQDYSIRRIALQLTVALIDSGNIRIVVPDLLVYLSACTDDSKADVAKQLCPVILDDAPSPEWRIDMSLKLLKHARQHVPIDFALDLIACITRDPPEVQLAAVKGLWAELSQPFDASQQLRVAMLVAALWCTGEYASYIIDLKLAKAGEIVAALTHVTATTIHTTLKLYGLTALMKVASRYPKECRDDAIAVFETYVTCLDCEVQQRAIEYIALLADFPDLGAIAFDAMPAMDHTVKEEESLQAVAVTVITETEQKQQQQPLRGAGFLDDLFTSPSDTASNASPITPAAPASTIDDLFGPASAGSAAAAPSQVPPVTANVPTASTAPSALTVDDLFGGIPTGAPQSKPSAIPHAAAAPSSGAPSNVLDDLFGPRPSAGATVAAPIAAPFLEVFSDSKVKVLLAASRAANNNGSCAIEAALKIQNTSSGALGNINVRIAVARTSNLELSPLPSNTLNSGASLTQSFTVFSPAEQGNGPLLLRASLDYTDHASGSTFSPVFEALYQL